MRIGVDLDEVTVEFIDHFHAFYKRMHGKDFLKKDLHTYSWWKVYGISKEEIATLIHEFYTSLDFEEMKPTPHSLESLRSLFVHHELFIITSRPTIQQIKTEAWLKKHLGDIDYSIKYAVDFFKSAGKSKAEICQQEQIDVLLEDAPHTALECAQAGTLVLLFDKPWNKDVEHDKVIRVANWLEAMKILKEQTHILKNSSGLS